VIWWGSTSPRSATCPFFRARGGRATSSRRIHLEVLFDTDAHLSAEDLAAAVQAREAKEELGFTIDPHHFGVLRCCRVRS